MNKRRKAISAACLLLAGAVAASLWFEKSPQAEMDSTKIDLDRMKQIAKSDPTFPTI
jgi:hypothetical protein